MLFCSGRGYYPNFTEIFTFRWYYPYFVEIYTFGGYYLHFVDIIRIGHIMSYISRNVCHGLHSFVLVVDIIYIGHTMSYLSHNLHPIFHIYSSSESDWCITFFPVWCLICFCFPSYSCLVCFLSEYKLNPNPIQIYVPPFITSIKDSFYFPLNFLISVLYWRVL